MSQRRSGYALQQAETYVTPSWVWARLQSEIEFWFPWDPCPINYEHDFLKCNWSPGDIVTNPPFSRADEFVFHALTLTRHFQGKVAFLLPHGYDASRGKCRKTGRNRRLELFTQFPYRGKYVLLDRIRWENLEQKQAHPSGDHAFYVWDWTHNGPPSIFWI